MHQEVEDATNQSGTNVAATTDIGGGSQRGSLSAADWLELPGPFNLLNISGLSFRVADAAAGRTPESPLAAVEVRLDAVDGPVLATASLTSTGGTSTWSTQSVTFADPGGSHRIFLVFATVPSGATGNNLFNLNWVEFVGDGISSVP
jgi:hypothetical protein